MCVGARGCVTHLAAVFFFFLMDSLYTAVVHSEHRALWKPIDLNQRVRESLSPHCSKLPVSLSRVEFMRWGRGGGGLPRQHPDEKREHLKKKHVCRRE